MLYLINEAERRKTYVTEYDVVKSIFLADVAHLNQYARPVTFDNFVAMEHGPVPSATRDVLQPEFNPLFHFGDEAWPLWTRERSPEDGGLAHRLVNPKRRENLRVLSDTDVHALSDALSVVKSLKFAGVRDETHKHPAYTEAWSRRGDKKAAEMDYAKLLDAEDDELIEDLVFSSK
ncbi:type II toxin-antitoxin system antitoxin SocA domain-containing protein [Bradyrhizobium sp. USDA 4508]